MKKIIIVMMILGMGLTSYAQKYHVTKVTGSRILIDKKIADDPGAVEYLKPYKHTVDSVMSPIVGESAKYMKAYGPESELSNLLADIMVWCGTKYDEKVDIGIYNMGGIRAALPKGKLTFGDINDMAPFENKIYFLTLDGKQLVTLMNQCMKYYGAGLSRGMRVVVSNHEVESVRLNGEPVDPNKKYRIATLDYLAKGNDGFRELQNGTDINSPQDNLANTRYLITDYFKSKMAAGEVVDSEIEGRVIIQ